MYGKYSICQEANKAWGKAKCCICLKMLTWVLHTSKDGALSVSLSQSEFLNTQAAAIFSNQVFSKCPFNWFLVNQLAELVWLVLT